QVIAYLAIVHGFIHANVESLPIRVGLIERKQNRVDQIADVNEITPDRNSIGIQHDRHGARPDVLIRACRADDFSPSRPSKNVFSERQRILEIILLHDPRSPQAAAVKVVLDEILLEHDFFQNLRQCIATWIRGVLLLLGHRYRMWVEEMSDRAVSAEQEKLPKRRIAAALFEEPEEAFNRHIHDIVRSFLARCAMKRS